MLDFFNVCKLRHRSYLSMVAGEIAHRIGESKAHGEEVSLTSLFLKVEIGRIDDRTCVVLSLDPDVSNVLESNCVILYHVPIVANTTASCKDKYGDNFMDRFGGAYSTFAQPIDVGQYI